MNNINPQPSQAEESKASPISNGQDRPPPLAITGAPRVAGKPLYIQTSGSVAVPITSFNALPKKFRKAVTFSQTGMKQPLTLVPVSSVPVGTIPQKLHGIRGPTFIAAGSSSTSHQTVLPLTSSGFRVVPATKIPPGSRVVPANFTSSNRSLLNRPGVVRQVSTLPKIATVQKSQLMQVIKLADGQPAVKMVSPDSRSNVVVVNKSGPVYMKRSSQDFKKKSYVVYENKNQPKFTVGPSTTLPESSSSKRFIPLEELGSSKEKKEKSPPAVSGVEDYLFGPIKKSEGASGAPPRPPTPHLSNNAAVSSDDEGNGKEEVKEVKKPEVKAYSPITPVWILKEKFKKKKIPVGFHDIENTKEVKLINKFKKIKEPSPIKEEPEPIFAKEVKEEPAKKTIATIDLDLTSDEKEYTKDLDLEWEDQYGRLPGSELYFKINANGLLELADIEENEMGAPPPAKKQKPSRGSDELTKCSSCGTYGMRSEFVERKFCGLGCQTTYNKAVSHMQRRRNERETRKIKLKERRRVLREQRKAMEPLQSVQEVLEVELLRIAMELELVRKEHYESDDELTCGIPCLENYLRRIKKHAAPTSLFKDCYPKFKNLFKVGMKLEAIDPMHPSLFCVVTIAEIRGFRLKLHFDGYSAQHDFWVNFTSTEIFQPGWCERTGHKLTPPAGHDGAFNWTVYLEQTNALTPPKNAFGHAQENPIVPTGFRNGMKLEAMDKKNSRLMCLATIADVIENRILVHIDGRDDDAFDYWADNTSPYIHPAGWCAENEHILHTPSADNGKKFSWHDYLEGTKSQPATARAFKVRGSHGFKRGMTLECVDRRNPELIRLATIIGVEEHQIRIKFEGWPSRYAYWVDSDSSDIHPVGYCAKSEHPLAPPPDVETVREIAGFCRVPGCTGAGHAYRTSNVHFSLYSCPYSKENYNNEDILPDRFATTAEFRSAKESSSSKGTKPRNLLKRARLLDHKKPSKKKVTKSESKSSSGSASPAPVPPTLKRQEKDDPLLKIKNELSSKIEKFDKDPRNWSIEEVSEFISDYIGSDKGSTFTDAEVDGEGLLMLSQNDLTDSLAFKVGPAIKLYNCIRVLRQQSLENSPTSQKI